MTRVFTDTNIMFKRNLTKTLRSPEAMIMALIVPVVMMVLFGFVFGGVAGDVEGFSYLNFIIPGIILQCICNMSSATSLSVHNDMTKGIFDRFRSMRISKSAFLSGHALLSILRSFVITGVIIGASFIVGFRPTAGILDWLIAIGILTLFITSITWIAIIFGLIAGDAESLSGITFLLVVVSFISSGFTPVESLPLVLRVFATHQPMTHIIDATRALLLDLPAGNSIWLALAWGVGISVVGFIAAIQIYKRKLTV